MRINADFTQRASHIADDSRWIHSPESGVDRQMLDRIGDEVARATSIVRYAAGSRFPNHSHAKGEEFLVLEGVFSDESGHYPAGTYVRNPPGSSHAPYSESGCQILVKLRQFAADDLSQFSIDCRDDRLWAEGENALVLHEFGDESVRMLRLAADDTIQIGEADGGAELFVISGAVSVDDDKYPQRTWLRFPPGENARISATGPCKIWQKTGHLRPLV